MNKLRVGVVGIGRLGSIHTRVYDELDQVDLVGVCDIDPQKLNSAAKQFKTSTFLEHKELIDKVDALSIAVPTNIHYQIAKDFINKGVHVLIEKPITNDLTQAKELIKLSQKNKVIMQIGHVERFNSAISAVEKIIKNPRFIECHRLSPFPHRSLDIGVVLDVMIHDIDIVLALVKSEIKTVEAVGVPVLTPYEDIANVRLIFENGCVCNLTASRVSEEAMRKIRIFLLDTYISLDYGTQEAFLYRKESDQIIKESLPIEKEEPLKREIESFIDCVKNNKRPLVSGEEAYQALQLSDKILKKIWSKKKIFIVAGEVSGDIHAASLVKELKEMNPSLSFMGLGGKHMEEEGVELSFDLTKIAVVGFTEILKNLSLFRKIFFDFINKAEQENPDLIILVDYPGFNLRLAKELKKRGFKIIYYISPQIWAWGEKRIDTIKKAVDKMIVLFDFEKTLYQNKDINVEFVGHPLLDRANQTLTKKEFIKSIFVENKNPIISLLPGSRNNEVKKIFPIMLESAKLIYKQFPQAQFLVLTSSSVDINAYSGLIKKYHLPIRMLDRQHYNAIASSDLALVASGTATLEAAILNTPMIIVYKVTFLTWAYAKTLIKIPYIGLVNVVAGKQIIPEFIQFRAKPKLIFKEAIQLLKNREKYSALQKELSQIKTHLGSPGASRRAAQSILSSL
ncbi:MAG: lipid-A-disaccharide synthase [Candidatus Omnitrophica bacterium]|nr:lipid-A-disaccharide synthase [Candidatus Omnitrophota bacterium]